MYIYIATRQRKHNSLKLTAIAQRERKQKQSAVTKFPTRATKLPSIATGRGVEVGGDGLARGSGFRQPERHDQNKPEPNAKQLSPGIPHFRGVLLATMLRQHFSID